MIFFSLPTFTFLSTPSARRATLYRSGSGMVRTFLSTPSARRATDYFTSCLPSPLFLSTPSARRATGSSRRMPAASFDFYPRPPRGGRPCDGSAPGGAVLFLSTPSARRATRHKRGIQADFGISIHALREEGDIYPFRWFHRLTLFLSTPSARRATGIRL